MTKSELFEILESLAGALTMIAVFLMFAFGLPSQNSAEYDLAAEQTAAAAEKEAK